MKNIRPENTVKKVPRMSFAVTSLVCGIFSLADASLLLGVFITGFITCPRWDAVISLPLAGLSIIIPITAIIFGAIPLKQGKGTDWDGKDMAKVGLLTAFISLGWIILGVACFRFILPNPSPCFI